MNSASLAQQLASGKATLATLNGQQVLIRTAGSPGNLLIKSPQPAQALVAKLQTPQQSIPTKTVQVRRKISKKKLEFLLRLYKAFN